LSYQCSQLSTSGSIIKLFKDAKKYQDSEKQNKKSFVAVVVLDEVGLAEDSPNFPLKSLHPLLEDGTESSNSNEDFSDQASVHIISEIFFCNILAAGVAIMLCILCEAWLL